jgi:hypothetical protein
VGGKFAGPKLRWTILEDDVTTSFIVALISVGNDGRALDSPALKSYY